MEGKERLEEYATMGFTVRVVSATSSERRDWASAKMVSQGMQQNNVCGCLCTANWNFDDYSCCL